MGDNIQLVEYDPVWPERYREEIARIVDALPPGVVHRAEHIGSTAVPGMIAKPIVDILIGVDDLESARRAFPPLLERLGFAYWEDNPKKDRLFFVKGLPPNGPRTFHIHVTTLQGEMWDRVLFRDYLRVHPEEVSRYERLKRDLAAQFPEDREAYSDGKTSYHREVVAKARLDPHLSGPMSAADILTFYADMERLGIPIWIDGGWGVDALLGKKTRPHGDLDIAMEQKHVASAVEYLRDKEYREVKRDSAWNFEMADAAGRKIDVHAFVRDMEGHVVEGIEYPDDSLTGCGVIEGKNVRCIAAEFMVRFRVRHEAGDSDVQDVSALCEKFGLEYPPEFQGRGTRETDLIR